MSQRAQSSAHPKETQGVSGGIVRVETKELPSRGVHGYVAADVLDASAMITAAIGSRVRLAVAGRYSYLDKILSGILSAESTEIFPVPRYDDYQAKLTIKLRSSEQLSVLFLAANDHLRRTIASADPNAARSESIEGIQ